ncbi:MAG: serine protease [Acidobacteria bacterium]|nr:MAG: serine protease [Acidobacteriota bacterium]
MIGGLVIHVSVGNERKTEFFSEEIIRIGTDDRYELQIQTPKVRKTGLWLEIRKQKDVYKITHFDESLNFRINDQPIKNSTVINSGDVISINGTDVSFSFFTIQAGSTLIRVNRALTPIIEEIALESSGAPRRDEAKIFLRELTKELLRETSLTTKLILLLIIVSFVTGLLYLGFSFNNELRRSREQIAKQEELIQRLEKQITQTNEQLSSLDKASRDIIRTVSLAPNLRVQYGDGVCLIVGTYGLVSRENGKILRYPDPTLYQPDPYEPLEGEVKPPSQLTLTTEGNGAPIEYDFIGTGFHVGGGYILTNKHVVQPWDEDELVKQIIKQADAKAKIKRLVVYFPKISNPIPLKVQLIGNREDIAVGMIDPSLAVNIPALPLEIDNSSDSIAIGKTVVSIGYPNGPDRLLAMLDDEEARAISAKFGNSRQNLLNYLAQNGKIQPLTTPGAITDLDSRKIVHDAKTAEGGSGAPLFGQSGKVIAINFGVFTENTASNMAVRIKFAVELLKRAGWKPPEELQSEQNNQTLTIQTK